MRWRFEREDLEMYKCCFCFHVRTGTLILGIINLLSHVAALAFLAIALSHPELIQQYFPEAPLLRDAPNWPADALQLPKGSNLPGGAPVLPAEPVDLPKGSNLLGAPPGEESRPKLPSEVRNALDETLFQSEREPPGKHHPLVTLEKILGSNDSMRFKLEAADAFHEKYDLSDLAYVRKWNLNGLIFATILLTVASMTIALCLLYGTITGVSKYITPFICVQLFDLTLSGLSMLSYFSDLPSVRRTIASQARLPFRDELMAMDNDHLTLLILIVFVSAFSIKAYFIGVVWSCYKYLKLHESMGGEGGGYGGQASSLRARIYDSEEMSIAEDTQMLLPPKYEDVLMMPEPEAPAGPPPPAYSPQ